PGSSRLRPHPVRQRVGRRRELPGRDPRRARARAAGRHRAEEDRGARWARALRARRRRRARRVRGAAPRRADRARGAEPAALPVRAGAAAREAEAALGRRAGASSAEARDAAARGARGTGEDGGDPPGCGPGRGRHAVAGGRVTVLCFVDGDELSAQAIGFARTLGDVRAVTVAGDYQPAAWAAALAAQEAEAIVAAGSDRGNELLAHVAAVLDQPFAANVTSVDGDVVTRVRWGGSLLEEARLHGAPKIVSVAPHVHPAVEIGDVETLDAPDDGSPKVLERVEESSGGVSLRDAKVVVSGGRGVGSA